MNTFALKTDIKALTLSFIFSIIVTALLFILMHSLIDIDYHYDDDINEPVKADFSYKKRHIKTLFEDKPLPPEEPATPPKQPEPQYKEYKPTGFTLATSTLSKKNGIKPVLNMSNDFPIAQMLSQPNYPKRALAHGIEGYVDVRFDITVYGSTENIIVVHASPENYFETQTIRAVKRWKFQPIIKRGEPQPYKGMTRRITFEMQK